MNYTAAADEIQHARYVEALVARATRKYNTAATRDSVRRMATTSQTTGVLSLRYAPRWPGLVYDLGDDQP